MRRGTKITLVLAAILATAALAGVALLLSRGFSAREKPSALEAAVASRLRHLAIPAGARSAKNPVAASDEVLAEARAHFADHCASCHGSDGKGETTIGRGLYPKAPDMTRPDTQRLTDGELFYIIENGVRFTGMPAWGSEHQEEKADSWKLVHLIRHFPSITKAEVEEMEKLEPVSPAELKEREEEERFLEGEPEKPESAPRPTPTHAAHTHAPHKHRR